MSSRHLLTRRSALAAGAGLIAAPAIIASARGATRGVTDTEIVIGCMSDLSGVTAVQGVNAINAMRLRIGKNRIGQNCRFSDTQQHAGMPDPNSRKIRLLPIGETWPKPRRRRRIDVIEHPHRPPPAA